MRFDEEWGFDQQGCDATPVRRLLDHVSAGRREPRASTGQRGATHGSDAGLGGGRCRFRERARRCGAALRAGVRPGRSDRPRAAGLPPAQLHRAARQELGGSRADFHRLSAAVPAAGAQQPGCLACRQAHRYAHAGALRQIAARERAGKWVDRWRADAVDHLAGPARGRSRRLWRDHQRQQSGVRQRLLRRVRSALRRAAGRAPGTCALSGRHAAAVAHQRPGVRPERAYARWGDAVGHRRPQHRGGAGRKRRAGRCGPVWRDRSVHRRQLGRGGGLGVAAVSACIQPDAGGRQDGAEPDVASRRPARGVAARRGVRAGRDPLRRAGHGRKLARPARARSDAAQPLWRLQGQGDAADRTAATGRHPRRAGAGQQRQGAWAGKAAAQSVRLRSCGGACASAAGGGVGGCHARSRRGPVGTAAATAVRARIARDCRAGHVG